MKLQAKRLVSSLTFAALLAFHPLAAQFALAANGTLLGTHTTLSGKRITGICLDTSDGSYWALGETTGKITHLDANFAKIGEINHPHGTGAFPNLILSRGIAFRPSSLSLLVLAKDGPSYKVKEVDRSGAEVPGGAFTIDPNGLANLNLSGLALDPIGNQIWVVDDANDLVLRFTPGGGATLAPSGQFYFPGNTPPETILRGSGVSFARVGATPFLYLTYGDISTLAPSRIVELRMDGVPTGVEIPLENIPPEEPRLPVREIGAIQVGPVGGKNAVVVVGKLGVLYVVEVVRPSPLPPSFFKARLTFDNRVILTWENHGTRGTEQDYFGPINIFRNGAALQILQGNKRQHEDDAPPPASVVVYSIRASDGGPLSDFVKTEVVIGKGGLIRSVPFPGSEPYDVARNPVNGDLFVTDSGKGEILRFDQDFQFKEKLPSPFTNPGGIAFNPAGNGGAGSLMVVTTAGVLMREIDLAGRTLDLAIPIDFRPIDEPRLGGLICDPRTGNYTGVETTSRQLITFDKNGNQKSLCTPPDAFTKKLIEGLALDLVTGNYYATFEGGLVRELFTSCTPTNFSFDLASLGETSFEPNFTRGIEAVENTLIVCGSAANALFQVIIYPRGDSFIRGDVDGNGSIQITDAIVIAEYLFKAGPRPVCLDAADSNDDSELDVSDPVYLLFFSFLSGSPPPRPFPERGTDPTFLDSLDC